MLSAGGLNIVYAEQLQVHQVLEQSIVSDILPVQILTASIAAERAVERVNLPCMTSSLDVPARPILA